MSIADRFVTSTGCTVKLLPAYSHLGQGAMLILRKPGDDRTAEVYLNDTDLEQLIKLVTEVTPAIGRYWEKRRRT